MEFETTSGTQSVQTTVFRVGPYALRVNPTAGSSFIRQPVFGTAQNAHGYLRVYVRIDSLPAATITIIRLADDSSNRCAQIQLTSTGTLILQDINGTQVGSPSTARTIGVWYRIELELDATSSPGSLSARIDGATAFASGASSAQAPWSRVVLGPVTTTTCDLYFADVAINDVSGSLQNSWPGDGVVITKAPSAAGDANAWNNTANTAGGTGNFDLVNELPPNDATDMVQGGTLNIEDLYNLPSFGVGANDTINVVMVGARFRNNIADATAAFKLECEKTSGGTIYQSAAIIPNSTSWRTNDPNVPRNYPIILHLDPDGSAWTPGTLDSMQVGIKQTATGTNRLQMSSIWAAVDYTPAAAPAVPGQIVTQLQGFF
jgi:hypothetical protein